MTSIEVDSQPKWPFVLLLIFFMALIMFCGHLFYTNTLGAQAPPNYLHVVEDDYIDYKVYLIQNDFIEKPYLGMNDNYLHSYTDHIEVTNSYQSKISSTANVKYTYSATATLIARYTKNSGPTESPEVLTRVYPLEIYSEEVFGTDFSMERTYEIDLEDYKIELASFSATTAIPLSNEVRLDFEVEMQNNDKLNSKMIRSMTIPLSDEFYNIVLAGDETKEAHYNAPKRSTMDTVMLVVYGFLIVGGFIGIIICIKKINAQDVPWYRTEIDSYLEDYDDAIINTTTPIDFGSREKIMIESFKELLNFATDTGQPIMYYENRKEAVFYLLNNEILHIFIVAKTKEKPAEEMYIRDCVNDDELKTVVKKNPQFELPIEQSIIPPAAVHLPVNEEIRETSTPPPIPNEAAITEPEPENSIEFEEQIEVEEPTEDDVQPEIKIRRISLQDDVDDPPAELSSAAIKPRKLDLNKPTSQED